mgnify:CR=1 FL=1
MQTLTLGRDGPRVPAFCLGTMTFGRQTAPEEAHRQLDLARERGLVFLDTAEMYPVNPVQADTLGLTETVIGDWIAARGGRDGLVIASKVTGEGSAVIEGGAPLIDAARLRQAVEDSLRRLRCDHIDLFQLHWPNRGSYHFRKHWTFRPARDAAGFRAHIDAVLTEAAALIAEGKIGRIGLSNESAWGLAQWLRRADEAGLPRIASVQNEYSLLCRLFDTDMAEACTMEEVPLLAFSPLATGLLTGKYAGDVTPEDSRRARNPDLGGRITPRVFEAVAAYLGLARDWGLDPVQMALAWQRTRPFAVIPILGATTLAQLQQQLPALELELDPGLVAAIDAVHRAHPLPY